MTLFEYRGSQPLMRRGPVLVGVSTGGGSARGSDTTRGVDAGGVDATLVDGEFVMRDDDAIGFVAGDARGSNDRPTRGDRDCKLGATRGV